MARNGSGTMTIPNPDFVAGTTISSTEVDANNTDIVNEITNSIAADGQTTASASIPFANDLATDVVAELTPAAGVTVDGVLLKDGGITSNGITDNATSTVLTIDDSGVTSVKTVELSKGADVASATNMTLGNDGNYFDITGTTNIETIATHRTGTQVLLQFDSALTLIHSGNLVLPSSANLDVSSGDHVELVEYATGQWRLVMHTRKTPGITDNATANQATVSDTAITINPTFQLDKGADIASATALTLGTDGNYFDVTGTTTIASIGAVRPGTVIKLHFDGSLTLTHSGNLVLPGGADIDALAGDEAEFVEYATGQWRCTDYTQNLVSPLVDKGTFTPVVADASSAGNLATGTFTGRYVERDGKAYVYLQLINIDTTGMTAGNDVFIRNIPFAPTSGTFAIGTPLMSSITYAGTTVMAWSGSATTWLRLRDISSGGAGAYLTVAAISSGVSDIYLDFEMEI